MYPVHAMRSASVGGGFALLYQPMTVSMLFPPAALVAHTETLATLFVGFVSLIHAYDVSVTSRVAGQGSAAPMVS